MSSTLAVARRNARWLLNDLKASQLAVSSPRLDRMIVGNAQELGSRAGYGMTWVANALTLTVGSLADDTLPTSVQYHQVIAMRLPATGQLLWKLGQDEINAAREGLRTGSPASGDPTYFACWEDETQQVKVRWDLVPSTARQVDVLRSSITPSTYTDATVLAFSDPFLRAIEKAAALEALLGLPPEERARLMIHGEVRDKWAADVERGVLFESARLNRIKRAPYGLVFDRWRS